MLYVAVNLLSIQSFPRQKRSAHFDGPVTMLARQAWVGQKNTHENIHENTFVDILINQIYCYSNRNKIPVKSFRALGKILEPMVRFELTTYCLQNSCSAAELHRHIGVRADVKEYVLFFILDSLSV